MSLFTFFIVQNFWFIHGSFTVLQVKQIPSWSGSLFSVIFFNHFEYGKSGKPNSYLIAEPLSKTPLREKLSSYFAWNSVELCCQVPVFVIGLRLILL